MGKAPVPTDTIEKARLIVKQMVSFCFEATPTQLIICLFQDHFELACLQSATMECKSFLMAMSLMFRLSKPAILCRLSLLYYRTSYCFLRKLSLSEACSASRVEEDFQTDIWGIVEGGHDMDKLNNAINLAAVDTFLNYYWTDSDKMMQRLATWKSIK